MALTPAEQLALLEATYADVLEKGQTVTVNGRSLTRPSLAELSKEIEKLQTQTRARSSGPMRAGLRRTSG